MDSLCRLCVYLWRMSNHSSTVICHLTHVVLQSRLKCHDSDGRWHLADCIWCWYCCWWWRWRDASAAVPVPQRRDLICSFWSPTHPAPAIVDGQNNPCRILSHANRNIHISILYTNTQYIRSPIHLDLYNMQHTWLYICILASIHILHTHVRRHDSIHTQYVSVQMYS